MAQACQARSAGLVALAATLAAAASAGILTAPRTSTSTVLPEPTASTAALASAPAETAGDALDPGVGLISITAPSIVTIAASDAVSVTQVATPSATGSAPPSPSPSVRTAAASTPAATVSVTSARPTAAASGATAAGASATRGGVQGRAATSSPFQGAGAAPRAGQPTAAYTDRPDLNARVLELTNAERTKRGLAPLSFSPCMSQRVAQPFAGTLASAHTIFHNNLSIIFSTCGGRTAGENVAMGQRTPEQVVAAWMSSEGHRQNILNPSFTSLGLGATTDASGVFYWVQNFNG